MCKREYYRILICYWLPLIAGKEIVEGKSMPIYEYECAGCGHKLEAIQKMSDAPLTDCPECEKPQLKKLVSAAGFRLKGGGW